MYLNSTVQYKPFQMVPSNILVASKGVHGEAFSIPAAVCRRSMHPNAYHHKTPMNCLR